MKTTRQTLMLLGVLTLGATCLNRSHGALEPGRPSIATRITPTLPTPNAIAANNELVSGNGRFVSVGQDGKLRSSLDGIRWNAVDAPVDDFIRGVTFANGQFVAVGGSFVRRAAVILTSSNGRCWTVQRCAARGVLHSVAFGADRFIAVGSDGLILSSLNGRAWHPKSAPTEASLAAVAFGKGIFVARGEDGKLLTSNYGVRWTPQNSGTRLYISRIVFQGDQFNASSNNLRLVSSDGRTWLPASAGKQIAATNSSVLRTLQF
jgi:hypothetical protein